MANLNILRARMAKAGCKTFTKELAEILGISRGAASQKLRGITPFKSAEISKIADKYNLTSEEVTTIFL